ncbi:unnamed protein product [Arabis nemorensis]|uniref:Uncharacterized protein n=1 Tax=Arabis nemorensis TaxID=586526 RepID=A0A565AXQ8_9BRAS|nr:unnamed protein product [Arabis nemorensis]
MVMLIDSAMSLACRRWCFLCVVLFLFLMVMAVIACASMPIIHHILNWSGLNVIQLAATPLHMLSVRDDFIDLKYSFSPQLLPMEETFFSMSRWSGSFLWIHSNRACYLREGFSNSP